MNRSKDYLNTREAAAYLQTNLRSLRRRRRSRLAPSWGRRNGRIAYRMTDLVLFHLAGIKA